MKNNSVAKSALIILLLTILFNYARAQEVVNGGFELMSVKKLPRNWAFETKGDKYQINADAVTKHTGRYSIKVEGKLLKDTDKALVYNLFGAASAKKINTIEISAWVKLAAPADSAVALMIQDLKGEKVFKTYAVKSRTGWQKLDLKFTATPDKAWYGFYYGFEIGGKVITWLDDVSVKVDGNLVSDPKGMYFKPGKANISWLNANLSPLKSAEIGSDHNDLAPIGKLCARATVVGIGEPTHGTSEAFKFKLRLLEYLVSQKGFNTIALEEVIPTCDIMNKIVNDNKGAIKDSLLHLPFYKCWKATEITAMLNWVSDYNQSHQNKVKLIGMDMEDVRCKTSRRLLREYGRVHDQQLYHQTLAVDKLIDTLIAMSNKEGLEAQTLKLADTVKKEFMKLQRQIDEETGTEKVQLFKLRTYVRVCQQWLNTRFYNAARDEYMADNIAFYLQEHPDDKVLVWAHNFHIGNIKADGAKQMGAYLKETFGKQYVSIGFTSAGGTYTAAADYTQKKWGTYNLEPAYQGTYEYILGKGKSNFYFLPLNGNPAQQKAASWLAMPMKHLDVPYIQSGGDDYKFYGNLNVVFDGVVFCKSTTAAASYLVGN